MQELEDHETELWALRGLFLVGVLMSAMGTMNAYNTISTIRAKRRAGARARHARATSKPA